MSNILHGANTETSSWFWPLLEIREILQLWIYQLGGKSCSFCQAACLSAHRIVASYLLIAANISLSCRCLSHWFQVRMKMSMGIRVLLTCACCRVYSSSPKDLTFLLLLFKLSHWFQLLISMAIMAIAQMLKMKMRMGVPLCLLPCLFFFPQRSNFLASARWIVSFISTTPLDLNYSSWFQLLFWFQLLSLISTTLLVLAHCSVC